MYHNQSDKAIAALCVLVLGLTWKASSTFLSQTLPIDYGTASVITFLITVITVSYIAYKVRLGD